MNILKLLTVVISVGLLGGCASMDQLSRVGEAPRLSAIENPTAQPGYKAVNMPMPEIVPASYQPNSLFSNQAKGFFKDQRAHRIGDILTVMVTIDDSAQISNATTRKRSSGNEANVGTSLGSVFGKKVPGVDLDATGGISTGGSMTDGGTGSVNRKESLQTNVAVVVTQVLPNGNLVIEGRQEVRVNFEVRDLIVAGIVRPEDIQSDNTIVSEKIAEARIAYGGRGQITDVQQPRYGQQIADAILPF
ncbi:MAG: flagellar basal body L-ring protein FlgH [Devosia sp.]|uniref:flagellar basal body L-ring protein FlgH n=1 Tax=Devosia sp. 66-22 TaxID=1895753 RepID=UPI00092C8F7E|nr:flagellar basal body L-ring protein FlgH [Devosia sp. 66-22]MBN9348447.1 flagellar basal body L-ring protein FlgH [Devosia sp.]OJX54536.1 MAG: flagellar basal body L-ring protein [Devosia sp. 66-22]